MKVNSNFSESKFKLVTRVNYTRSCVFCQVFLEKIVFTLECAVFSGFHIRVNIAIVK